jgi:hypothetical protein
MGGGGMSEASYVNNKNELIPVTITAHARARFKQRWPAAFPTKNLLLDIDAEIISLFNKSVRVKNFSRKERTRLRRYGKDTLFFRNNSFTFVVQNASIVTVELSSRNLRKFNSADSDEIARRAEEINLRYNPDSTVLRLAVYYIDAERNIKVSNLGSFPLTSRKDVSQLKMDSTFLAFIKNKLVEKFPQNTEFCDVYSNVGKGKEINHVFEQSEIQHLLA